jgi:hypothetical protein
VPRPLVASDGTLIVVDDPTRMRRRADAEPRLETVRFRTLGCWAVTGAVRSAARDVAAVVEETVAASASERRGRLGDREADGSVERQRCEGYFWPSCRKFGEPPNPCGLDAVEIRQALQRADAGRRGPRRPYPSRAASH